MPDYYFELRRGQTEAIQVALEIFAELCVEYEELSRRSYGPFEAYRLDDAETALVCLGSSAGTAKDVVDELRAEGEAVGLLKICSFRPFPAEETRAVLAGLETVVVLDRADSPGGAPPLFAEIAAALLPDPPALRSHVYGLGGRDLHPADIRAALDGHRAPLRRRQERAMPRLKSLVRTEGGTPPLRSGHSLCQGCGIPMVVRTVLDSIEGPKVVVSATGCLEVATTRYPTTAWNVPWLHVAFENAAAAASGVESAYRALRRRGGLPQEDELTIVAFAGDGGTYDIGLQALSGALERGHRFVFVCYDNQAYMNTGVQRSGATPFGAATTTTPAGEVSFGKLQQRKDLTAIVAAHKIPYVAQSAAGPHWQDLSRKAALAGKADGPAFLNVLADCPLGWGHDAKLSPSLVDGAVESCVWPLYEVDDGHWRLTYRPERVLPVADWLGAQKRFAHLFTAEAAEVLAEAQRRVDDDWTALLERCEEAVCVAS